MPTVTIYFYTFIYIALRYYVPGGVVDGGTTFTTPRYAFTPVPLFVPHLVPVIVVVTVVRLLLLLFTDYLRYLRFVVVAFALHSYICSFPHHSFVGAFLPTTWVRYTLQSPLLPVD